MRGLSKHWNYLFGNEVISITIDNYNKNRHLTEVKCRFNFAIYIIYLTKQRKFYSLYGGHT